MPTTAKKHASKRNPVSRTNGITIAVTLEPAIYTKLRMHCVENRISMSFFLSQLTERELAKKA